MATPTHSAASMATASASTSTIKEKTHSYNFFVAMFGRIKDTAKKAKKIGEDDPRRIFHAVKVGLALTLVSLFYYSRPLYDGFGQAGMWAVLTVVVVFEFSVGGTISKCLNRGGATLVAGALGVGAEYLATLCGERGEPIVLGLLVFVLAAVSTFTRFIPGVKRRYDYGVLIFILTFSLVAVSGARVTDILEVAHQRLSTILIGGATCMVISLCVCPVWAGLDLHNLIANNMGKLAASLEGFGGDFGKLTCKDGERETKPSNLESYKIVMNTKANEELLANLAWWEPRHGGFKLNHPWKLYLNVGGLLRQCACQIQTLHGCIIKSTPKVASELQEKIQPLCEIMGIECGKALKELAATLKNMRAPSSDFAIHLKNSIAAADELKNIMENSSFPTDVDLNQILPMLVVASVLVDVVKFVEKISVSVGELSEKACFKEIKPQGRQLILHRGIVKPVDDEVVVVEIVEAPTNSSEIKNPS